MPLGWERLNVRQSTPNKNIVFIKPLPGASEKTGQDFLERIAAQCMPIMNKHHLAVVSLEEYPYNTEFLGRNFNNGEVIQLVLRSSTGTWLPFSFVQMVMMHELAHNKQMNHSKAFWAVRNVFANEMKALWATGYTGDGLWGRGVLLENGLFTETLLKDEAIPEHTCGGTFRSRGGTKRKAKPKITYKELRERRIRKKFGTNGVALGADDELKAKLEKGKKLVGKPRVAASARGRELRAAAALARFEVKIEEEPQIKDEDMVTDSEADSDTDDAITIKPEEEDAIDINGVRLLDSYGRGMVKMCEDEDKDDDNTKNELLDLRTTPGCARIHLPSTASGTQSIPNGSGVKPIPTSRTIETQTEAKREFKSAVTQTSRLPHNSHASKHSEVQDNSKHTPIKRSKVSEQYREDKSMDPKSLGAEASCPTCSVINEPNALTCEVCANVLKPEFVLNSWLCKSSTCRDGKYRNAGDVGVCGVCGARKEAPPAPGVQQQD
jgi:hypothetical protein